MNGHDLSSKIIAFETTGHNKKVCDPSYCIKSGLTKPFLFLQYCTSICSLCSIYKQNHSKEYYCNMYQSDTMVYLGLCLNLTCQNHWLPLTWRMISNYCLWLSSGKVKNDLLEAYSSVVLEMLQQLCNSQMLHKHTHFTNRSTHHVHTLLFSLIFLKIKTAAVGAVMEWRQLKKRRRDF